MAGDWIKFEITTPDKPEVWSIAQELNIDPDAAVGKLLRVWSWFDQHTEEGNAPSVTKMLLDRIVGVTGFCDAVIKAGWMIEDDSSISLSNFSVHNGKTAKNRAVTAKRVASHKERKRSGNDTGNAATVTTPLPKEEKRREDINNPPTPRNRGELNADQRQRFERFWQEYPNKKSIGHAEKAFAKLNPDDLLTTRMIKALHAQISHRSQLKAAGEFVPEWKHPATWLNAKDWENVLTPVQQQRPLTGTHLSAVRVPGADLPLLDPDNLDD